MTPFPASGRAEGERRRDAAHALLVARRECIVRRGRRALLLALINRGTATADDVRSAVRLPPEIGPRCLGAVPGELARAGLIRRIGYTPSTRPTAHARPTAVWELLDADGARLWLSRHPDLPDVAACQGDLFAGSDF